MCSGIRLIAKDGTVVVGRTAEFGQHILKFRKYRNGKIKGVSTHDGKVMDAVNEAGLVVFIFYFANYAKYGSPRIDKINVKPTDLSLMLLERAENVEDVIGMVGDIQLVHEHYPPFAGTPPVHWLVTDANGKSIVLEPTGGGKITVYENTLGIFANSPSFPEHIREVNKALKNISTISNPKADSQGTGGIGLPGDYSSVSRFIRLAFFAENVVQPKNKVEALNVLIHILNNFDIPIGSVQDYNPHPDKKVDGKAAPWLPGISAATPDHIYETTLYTSYYDITNRKVFYKTYNNQNISKID